MSPRPTVDLKDLDHLGARREVASAVLQLISNEDAGASEVAKAASVDPLFSARIMKMANSTYYGLSGKVRELHFAVAVLGFLTVRSLAVASMLNNLTPISRESWRRFLVKASISSSLAPFFEVDPAVAFSSGMMQDLGELVLARQDPRRYAAVHKELTGLPLYLRDDLARERERDIYGMDHCEVSAQLLESWKFPSEIIDAVRSHHDHVHGQASLGRVLYSAGLLAPYYEKGYKHWDPTVELPPELLHLDVERIFLEASSFVEEFLEFN